MKRRSSGISATMRTRTLSRCCLKSITDGAAFLEAVRAVASVKPVIVLKTGRNKTAQRAAGSHTAALAGDYRITAAALRQAGVRLVEDGLTLLDVAAALASQPPLRGNRIAIITNSGGTGVELTDLFEDEGLAVPQLSDELQSEDPYFDSGIRQRQAIRST